ncbi:hypothetical protein HMPREF9713_02990 [Myroides odoratimimus CCUG 12700]|uniref:hypothetical protein n=1 Tax=Myroides odoratimimus TaxID=76832 RepID=UPI0003536EA0|nr:hypothetical protein [Myroides odoratimimus]EPH08535.1 hypothetical protein HMPREF9713_02990 [Myroides odoratimimus CCUG 12700]MDM1452098.1 hypothetical protein [Myroides odoratimimus]MDM1475563.1 hypothetical protein [Myroides odoratimimus]MDM1488150.1 hypothetical protein [Myroides odoratimimus]
MNKKDRIKGVIIECFNISTKEKVKLINALDSEMGKEEIKSKRSAIIKVMDYIKCLYYIERIYTFIANHLSLPF